MKYRQENYFFLAMMFMCIFLISNVFAEDQKAGIELFMAGEKFQSMGAYNDFRDQQFSNKMKDEKDALDEVRPAIATPLMKSVILEEIDLDFDPKKAKSWVIGEDGQAQETRLPIEEMQQNLFGGILKQASVNEGVQQAVVTFAVMEGNKLFHDFPKVNQDNLAQVLEKTLKNQSGAVLLVSDDQKVRLMQLGDIEGLSPHLQPSLHEKK